MKLNVVMLISMNNFKNLYLKSTIKLLNLKLNNDIYSQFSLQSGNLTQIVMYLPVWLVTLCLCL